jgi:multidrug efflux pump subunit AcrB
VSFEFDQTPVVNRSIQDLLKEGALGAVLTGLMVLVFLRDLRTAFIVVINIPLSLLAASFGLWITGQNIHLMTLGGLALAVGILVDEATVTVENIHTHLARGKPLARAALDGTLETTLPRLLAMLCILAVFIPAFFMIGAAKALFVPLALAVGFAMFASFILSSTLVPVLSVWFLPKNTKHDEERLNVFARMYQGIVKTAVTMRWVLVPAYLGGAALIIVSFGPFLGSEIFPKTDTGQFAIRFRAPAARRSASRRRSRRRSSRSSPTRRAVRTRSRCPSAWSAFTIQLPGEPGASLEWRPGGGLAGRAAPAMTPACASILSGKTARDHEARTARCARVF